MKKNTKQYKIALQLNKILEQIKKLEIEHPWFDVSHSNIALGHAMEDSRCNGTERLTSLLDVFFELRDHASPNYKTGLDGLEQDMRKTIKACNMTLKLIQKARSIFFKKYQTCPECNGKHGEGVGVSGWQDCDNCNGLGFIERNRK